MRLFLLLLTMPAAAQAAGTSPQVGVNDDGHVTGHVVVPVSADRVQQELSDVRRSDGLSAEVLETKTHKVGDCIDVTRSVRGLWSPLTYTARRCPTANGWTETLVRSDDFAAYESEWQVVAVEGGTRIDYRVQTSPQVPVPSSVVRSRTQSSVRTMLRKLVDRLSPSRRRR